MRFRGMIYTDGFGVSITKQIKETEKSGTRGQVDKHENDFKYIHQKKTI